MIKGMTRAEAKEIRDQQIEKIVEVVKTMGQATYTDLFDLTGIPQKRISNIKDYILEKHPELGFKCILTKDGRVSSFSYSQPKSALSSVQEEKPVTKNGEGYPDPTMAKALSRIENRSGMKYEFCVGEIWRDDSTCGAMYLIMSCYKNSLMCLILREMDNFYDPRCDIMLAIKDQEYYVSPYKILSRPARVMTIKFANTKPDFMSLVKSATAMHLGYRMETMSEPEEKIVEVPVEKIVEKEVRVEVPVPVEKIVYRDKPTESNELLEYKAAMWDRYIDTVLPV